MPSHPAPLPDPAGFTVADATIHQLANVVHEAHRDDLQPSLIRTVLLDDGRIEIGFRSLEGEHPAAWLTGFDAPAEWDSIGLVVAGTVLSPDDLRRTDQRAHITTVVSRRGEVASVTSVDGRDAEPMGERPGGLTVDLLFRSLQLPTDPAPCTSSVFFLACWFAEMLDRVDAEDDCPSWDELVWLHPAMALLSDDGDVSATDFLPVLRSFERVMTWSRLRRVLDDGRFSVEGLRPGDGAWFDDGAFARHVLATIPPFSSIRRLLPRDLPTQVVRRIDGVMRELGVPEVVWPEFDRADERRSA